MEKVIRTEHFVNEDQLPELFLQSWKKKEGGRRGLFFITHGISEHSDCYDFLGQEMAENDWTVFAWDLQGHGRSQGPRGYIPEFTDFRDDILGVLRLLKSHQDVTSTPMVLFGHSMGGLITTQALLQPLEIQPQACVLSCPAFGLAQKIPAPKESAAQWMNQFWPTLTINNGLNFEHLTRDPQILTTYKTDSLRHRKVSAPLFLGMKEGMAEISQNIEDIPCPILVQVAGKDTVIDTMATLEVYKKMPQPKKLHLYEESFHEIYNDINRREVIDHLHEFLGELNL